MMQMQAAAITQSPTATKQSIKLAWQIYDLAKLLGQSLETRKDQEDAAETAYRTRIKEKANG